MADAEQVEGGQRAQRNTGSFATRLLQKALDDRKRLIPI